MAEVVSLGAGEAQTVKASEDAAIVFHTEYSDRHDRHGEDGYSVIVDTGLWAMCDAMIELSGMTSGDPVDVAWSRMTPTEDGKGWQVRDDAWRTTVRAGSDGTVQTQLGGQFGLDEHVRLRLRVYNSNDYPVTLTMATAKVTLLHF